MKLAYITLLMVFVIGCVTDSTDNVDYIEKIERFNVEYRNDSLLTGVLNFKEKKYFTKDGELIKRELFDTDERLKGTEIITLGDHSSHSIYKDTNDVVLSKYKSKYEHGLLLEKRAFDSNDNLLRIEQYDYTETGQQKEKIILDANDKIQRVYKFAYDNYGNELGFSAFDYAGKLIALETYNISELDEKNRWIKKWGERDSVIYNYYERTFTNLK